MNDRPAFDVRSLTIYCVDRWRSGDFYEKVLGAVVIPGDLGCQWYRLGSFTINLMPGAVGRHPVDSDRPMTMLWLEVPDLQTAGEHFRRLGVEVVQASDGQMMTIADPDGLPIEVWERQPDDADPKPSVR